MVAFAIKRYQLTTSFTLHVQLLNRYAFSPHLTYSMLFEAQAFSSRSAPLVLSKSLRHRLAWTGSLPSVGLCEPLTSSVFLLRPKYAVAICTSSPKAHAVQFAGKSQTISNWRQGDRRSQDIAPRRSVTSRSPPVLPSDCHARPGRPPSSPFPFYQQVP